jgi:hypothetical protein
MKRKTLLVILILLFIPSAGSSQITYDAGKQVISIHAEERLLSDLLAEISSRTGITVYMDPVLDRKVSLKIKRQPVDVAIKQAVSPLNHAFVYQKKTVRDVWIFEKSQSEATTRIAPVIKDAIVAGNPDTKGSYLNRQSRQQREKALEDKRRERRRQAAISQGRLAEFEAYEAKKEKRKKELESRRQQRREEIKRMKIENEQPR